MGKKKRIGVKPRILWCVWCYWELSGVYICFGVRKCLKWLVMRFWCWGWLFEIRRYKRVCIVSGGNVWLEARKSERGGIWY